MNFNFKPTEGDLIVAQFARSLQELNYSMIKKDLEKLSLKGVLTEEETRRFERLLDRKQNSEKELGL